MKSKCKSAPPRYFGIEELIRNFDKRSAFLDKDAMREPIPSSHRKCLALDAFDGLGEPVMAFDTHDDARPR
jgi:hypothetical protein